MKDGKYVILCIDDDADFLEAMRLILERNEYEVVTACGTAGGLEAFREAEPDVVIVDMVMEEPDSGIKLVEQLRGSRRHVPIYLCTGMGDTLSSGVSYHDLGLAGGFEKPMAASTLLATLRAKLRANQWQ
jgi:two-component system, OmpR family, response regulator MtrA